MAEADYTFKILTLGESGVGKTCILKRYVDNTFMKTHLATIGIDFKSKIVNIDNKIIKIKVWDTAGQDRFRNITSQYYKGADGIVLVFDITDKESFKQVDYWINQISNSGICMVLVGNKSDEKDKRVVTFEEGKELADSLKVPYFETSALNGEGINLTFETLTKEILKKKNIVEPEGVIQLTSNSKRPKKNNGCCS